MIKKVLFILFIGFSFYGHSQSKKVIRSSEKFANGLIKRNYKGMYKQLGDTFRSIMPYLDFQSLLESIERSSGRIIGKELIVKNEIKDIASFQYKLLLENDKALILSLSYNEKNKVIGMFFRPEKTKVGYLEPTSYGKSSLIERKLELPTPAGDLNSVLTLPIQKDKSPVVILVHGSGPNDMDESIGNNKVFYDLTLGLIDSGIGTFRYNKRTFTYGKSFSDTCTLWSEVIEDVLSAVQMLKQQDGVDTNRIYVLGHSLGAMSAPFIAQHQKDLAGIIMMGSPCRALWESIPMQLRYLKENTNQEITDEMIADADKTSIRITEGNYDTTALNNELFGVTANYWNYLKKKDVVSACKKLHLPILIMQGERDYQVNMDDFQCFKSKLGQVSNIKLKVIPGSNHLFIFGQGKSVPSEYQIPGNVDINAINSIANWINEEL